MHIFLTQLGYLDPGTGSIIIQAIIGVAAGIAVFGRRTIHSVSRKIQSWFGKKTNKDDEA